MKLQDISDGQRLRLIGSDSRYFVLVEDISRPKDKLRKYVATVQPVKRRRLSRAAEARVIAEAEALLAQRKEQNHEDTETA